MTIFTFRDRAVQPPTVSTDTIVPFHYYDDTKNTNGLCFDFTFRFDDLLDDRKIRDALSRLLELGDWRKLGARIRRNKAGALEYHVPAQFGDQRTAFTWSTATFDVAVDAHPLAARLAHPHSMSAAGRPVTFSIPSYVRPSRFKTFIRSPGFPDKLEDWLYTDSPLLGVHVMHFRDATLMTMSFLHSLTDMMGLSAILEAWTAVLNGKEDQVKPFLAFSHDPLQALSQLKVNPEVRYRFADLLLAGWSWILFATFYFFSIQLFWRRREEERMIFLPAEHVARMKKEVAQELVAQAAFDSNRVSFVSEGDIIFAWWTRIVMRAENASPNRTIHMRNTCCCRSIFKELGIIPSTTSALVTNAVFPSITFLKIRQVLDRSLAVTASQVRTALNQQRKAEQLQALDVIRRECLDNSGHPAIFGDANMFMFMISNWEKAKLFKLDFSAAVVGKGLSLELRTNELGRPSCIQGSSTRPFATRNTGVVIGKDAGGNYWLAYNLRRSTWLGVERELVSMIEGNGKE